MCNSIKTHSISHHFSYVFLLLLFATWSSEIFASNKTLLVNDQPGTLRVGCEIDYPPYCFVNEHGDASGFSVDLFRAVAKEMGLEVTFITGPWEKLKYDLASGKLDALPLVGKSPERENLFDFTIPYLTMHGTIVVREHEDSIQSVDDLTGKQVAVMKGDNAEEYLRRINLDADIIQRTTFKYALKELSEGKHDAVVIQRLLALQLMKENGFTNLKLAGKPDKIYQQAFSFAVQEGNDKLQSILNEGLSIISANGTYRKLQASWFAPLEAISDPERRIIIGGDFNFPPYEFLDENGNPAGYNVDLIKAIAKEMGMKIEIHLGPWTEIRHELKEGHIDAVQGILYSPERDKDYEMSPAHTNISYVIVVREDTPLPKNLKELKGKSILVQKGDLMHDHLLKHQYTDNIIAVNSQEEALSQLTEGKYDYALAPKVPAHYYMEKNGWDNLIMNKEPLLSAEYCLGVPEGNNALLSRLSEGLKVIQSKGIYRDIYSSWLGVYEKPEVTFADVLRYFLFILVPLIIVLALSILWWYTLKKKVKERTLELQKENSARKKAEEQIKKLYEQLKTRNEEIAAQNEEYQTLNEELKEKNDSLLKMNEELVVAKEKAQESDQLKSAFLANISHEIRTPMNGIMGFTELLKNPRLKGEKKDEFITLILKSGKRMLRIIDNLLNIARIEANQVELNITATSINETVNDVVSILEQEANKKDLSVNVRKNMDDSDSIIMTDPVILNQVLTNLLNNAIKYTDEGYVSIGYQREKDSIHFYIQDTGIGIPGELQKKIFERFRQADYTITRPYEGAGLGLSISKAYVELLGGSLWLESTPGLGSTFHFTIPFTPADLSRSNTKTKNRIPLNEGHEMTLLVAEDDETSFLLLKEALAENKVELIRAKNGQEAIEFFKKNPHIDMALVDIKMPVMDGYEVTRTIKKMNPAMPVIAQTAFASKDDERKAYQAGCDGYISKPVDTRALLELVDKLKRN